MAKYQYACFQCDKDYEKERTMAEAEPIYHCDSCGYALARVYSPVGVSFKGKGFYSTDNR